MPKDGLEGASTASGCGSAVDEPRLQQRRSLRRSSCRISECARNPKDSWRRPSAPTTGSSQCGISSGNYAGRRRQYANDPSACNVGDSDLSDRGPTRIQKGPLSDGWLSDGTQQLDAGGISCLESLDINLKGLLWPRGARSRDVVS